MSPAQQRAASHTTSALVGAVLAFMTSMMTKNEHAAAIEERTVIMAQQIAEVRSDVKSLAHELAAMQAMRARP
jgi:hypothetical protein